MRKISEHYEIPGELPFLDVAIDEDNLTFVDLCGIRLSDGPEPYRSRALAAADTFLDEVTQCIIEGSPSSIAKGRALLRNFREPWETRLGMSEAGYFGRGGAAGVGESIWAVLSTDLRALASVGVLKKLERIPLFVEGVGADICSDLTTRVIYESLVAFTEEMMLSYPELQAEVSRVKATMWDADTLRWVEREVVLPAPLGRALLLVPVGWARKNPLMTASRYYGVTVLGHVQDAEAYYSAATQRVIVTPKDELRGRDDLKAIRPTNIAITLAASESDVDLLAAFEAYLASWLRRQERDAA